MRLFFDVSLGGRIESFLDVGSLEDALGRVRTDGLEHREKCADPGDVSKYVVEELMRTTYKTVTLSLTLAERSSEVCFVELTPIVAWALSFSNEVG